jgi:four helix bundle protein
LHVYKGTKSFPKDEIYGLTSQIRRSAVSIPSNIAEGYGRKTTLEYVRFLYIAYGSVCELETQVMISGDLGYMEKERLGGLKGEIGDVERMLKALIKSLESKHLDPWVTWQWLPVEMEGSLKSQSHPE